MSDAEASSLIVGVAGALLWLLWPSIGPRLRRPRSPIPPASIAGRVDFEAMQKGTELTPSERVRVALGVTAIAAGAIVALVLVVGVLAIMSGFD